MRGLGEGKWRIRDSFGEDWVLAVVPLREGDGARPALAAGEEFRLESLLHFAFATLATSTASTRDDPTADVLRDVYEAITGDSLAERHAGSGGGDDAGLGAIATDIERAFSNAFRIGQLRIEPLPRPPLPFWEPVGGPASLARPPVADQKTYFVLRVVDEVGASLDGISVVFNADGNETKMTTDGAGMARLDGVEASSASVRLGSIAALREKLKPRWAEPREPSIPTGDGIVVREVGDEALESIALESETLATLVLTPYFQCHEIPGAHFEFGRSFVRSEALDLLSEIAEALTGDAGRKGMIFGHTDLAGPEPLNKELSERRAKALYSLLTQDADAWEELYSGSADGASWQEKWDLEEIQHMLNALGVTDDNGGALQEDGVNGALTTQAVKRFQAGNYPDCPAEQAPLATDGDPGKKTRHELFLAYAKRISRKAVDPARITKLGDAAFMGCGEFNPMSLTVKDEESRRAVIFLYDPAAEPQKLPCKLRSLGPCKSNCGPLATAPDPAGKPPYRCKVYRAVAQKCPCQAGPDLAHDLVVRITYPLDVVNGFNHVLVVESDDGTISRRATLKSDAHAVSDEEAEVYFPHLPPTHQYRMRAEGIDAPYEVFGYTAFDALSALSLPPPDASEAPPPPDLALNASPADDPPPADGDSGAASAEQPA